MRVALARELDEYPGGLRRWRILAMAVLAVLIGSYEGQIAAVVPLLVTDLQMPLATYGMISAAATVAGAIAAAVGGRLTDHLGRVRLLVPFLLLTAMCCFGMTLVHSTRDLLLARVMLSFVDGMAMSSTAPLVRDFTSRQGRAQAFGFWTWGPVGASLLAAALAAWTLPVFHDSWRSQFVLMGGISLVMSVVIACNIADLSPRLRAQIRDSGRLPERSMRAARPPRARDLAARPRIWAHLAGICSWMVLYLSLAMFGQVMLVDSFGVSTADASAIMTAFWMFDLVVLVVVGRVSDRLGLRKIFSVVGTVGAALVTVYLAWLTGRTGVSSVHLMITGATLGSCLAVAYGPWMANYSEDAEDIDTRLQGTAWGIFGCATRVTAVLVVLTVPLVVSETGWGTWLLIATVGLVLFLPVTGMFGGPWCRRQEITSFRVPVPTPA